MIKEGERGAVTDPDLHQNRGVKSRGDRAREALEGNRGEIVVDAFGKRAKPCTCCPKHVRKVTQRDPAAGFSFLP